MAPRQAHRLGRRPFGAGMTYPFPNESQLPHCRMEMHRNAWVCRAKDRFQQLILFGESQPSNGTVRSVGYPDGKTVFILWYGSVPDNDLQTLLETIYSHHGEVNLLHDGRDSTGKHWIKCVSKVQPGSFEQPSLKATICVFSKLERATMPQPWTKAQAEKGKAKGIR